MITHGHEDHLGALPWVLRDLGQDNDPGRLRRPADGRDGALQARRAQAARRQPRGAADRRQRAGRPVQDRAHPPHALDPGRRRRRADDRRSGTVLFTGDYKFDQTPVGGAPADMARLAELGREGLLLLCGDSTNADRPGISRERVDRRPAPRARVRATARAGSSSPASRRTSTASSRSSHAAAANGRKVALVGPLDAQERQHRPHARAHRRPRGHARPAARDRPVRPTRSSS